MDDRPTQDRPRRAKCAAACDSCKRRKERCDGVQPCSRCHLRGVDLSCVFSKGPSRPSARTAPTLAQRRNGNRLPTGTPSDGTGASQSGIAADEVASARPGQTASPPGMTSSLPAHFSVPWTPDSIPAATEKRLPGDPTQFSMVVAHPNGQDSDPVLVCHPSGFALLHNVRTVVQRVLPACDFLQDTALKERDGSPDAHRPRTAQWTAGQYCEKPSLEVARYYLQRYNLATSWWLDVDGNDLYLALPGWTACPTNLEDPNDAIHFLILAIGAQTSPDDHNDLANRYFSFARYLVAGLSINEPNIAMVRCYCLISMYLLNDAQSNAAFAQLGMAIRAAQSLGLHSEKLAAYHDPTEYELRSRVWKSVRFMDVFLSASLGRPTSTRETGYEELESRSSALSICHIYESIMGDVYAGSMTLSGAIDKVSEKQREWASQLDDKLAFDYIPSSTRLNGGGQLNISLLHVKQTYYCSIILLTWPSLYDNVKDSILPVDAASGQHREQGIPPFKAHFATTACIDSAIKMIDVLIPLKDDPDAPKCLPVIMHSAFVAALVIGIALFAGFEDHHPLFEGMQKAIALFGRFPDDKFACQVAIRIGHLYDAWHKYHSLKTQAQRQSHTGRLVETFGSLRKITGDDCKEMGTIDAQAASMRSDGIPAIDHINEESLPSGDPWYVESDEVRPNSLPESAIDLDPGFEGLLPIDLMLDYNFGYTLDAMDETSLGINFPSVPVSEGVA